TKYPFIVAVAKRSPINSLDELLGLARKTPESVTYGSAGIGSGQHLVGELLASSARVKFLHVAYKGEIPALADLVGGRVQFIVLTAPTALPRIQAGDLKPLAVTGKTRWAALPNIPTVSEAGLESFDVTSWLGLAAPKGTPAAEIARLSSAFQQAQQVPEARRSIEALGSEIYVLTPAQTRELVLGDVRRWKEAVRMAGVVAE
ncbi:MAG: Bug family tripartite tricarboxylate transporter substrate binding protein, partial [Dongiaceae bacterium]